MSEEKSAEERLCTKCEESRQQAIENLIGHYYICRDCIIRIYPEVEDDKDG